MIEKELPDRAFGDELEHAVEARLAIRLILQKPDLELATPGAILT